MPMYHVSHMYISYVSYTENKADDAGFCIMENFYKSGWAVLLKHAYYKNYIYNN